MIRTSLAAFATLLAFSASAQQVETTEEFRPVLKAQATVHQMALRALVHAHPDPAAVLAEWRRIRADAVNAAYVLPSDERSSAWLGEHVQAFAEDWTAELVEAVTARDADTLEASTQSG